MPSMPTSFFLVRAVVAEPLRDKFDHWYSTDHLPWAIKVFKCEKAWRFWSETEPGGHYAVYRFADRARLDAAMQSEGLKELIADFDLSWPEGVTRTRDIVSLVEERDAS
jgi:hypothetical protein